MAAALQRKNVGRHVFTVVTRWAGARGTRPHQNLFSALGTAFVRQCVSCWNCLCATVSCRCPLDGGIELLCLHPHVYPVTFNSTRATSSIPACLPKQPAVYTTISVVRGSNPLTLLPRSWLTKYLFLPGSTVKDSVHFLLPNRQMAYITLKYDENSKLLWRAEDTVM